MSTITLLDAVNEVLKRTRKTRDDFVSLTDAGAQEWINIAVASWNDAIMAIQKTGSFTGEVAEGAITLVDKDAINPDTGQPYGVEGAREYDLPADYVQMTGQDKREMLLIDHEESRRIYPYNGRTWADYQRMWTVQVVPEKYQGYPTWWAINPKTGKLRIDTTPGSEEAGKVYRYNYERSIFLRNEQDTFPYHDQVIQALFESVAQAVRDKLNEQFNPLAFDESVGKALSFVSQQEPKARYGQRLHNLPPRQNYTKIPHAAAANRLDWIW